MYALYCDEKTTLFVHAFLARVGVCSRKDSVLFAYVDKFVDRRGGLHNNALTKDVQLSGNNTMLQI